MNKQRKDTATVLTRPLRLLFMLCIALGGSGPISAEARSQGCAVNVTAFLAKPNEHALKSVSGAEDQKCWAVIESSNANLNNLIHSVEQGNRWAAQYLAEHLKKLDGGNLEDSLVALGQFSNDGMEQLLRFKRDGHLSEHEFMDALTMLPLSLSDNPSGQLNTLKARRQRVSQITREDLAEEKAIALKAIDEFASEITSKNMR